MGIGRKIMKKIRIKNIVRKFKNYILVEKAISHYDLDDMPVFEEIEIETLNRCNGTCDFCPVNANEPQRVYHKMSKELFEKIIQDLEEINYEGKISLFSNNEPFLDERIIEFHKSARAKLPNAHFSLYTNGSLLDKNKFVMIIPYLDELHIDNYNDDKNVNPGLKEVYDYLNENPELEKKVTFHMRLQHEILTSRGGQAPNKKNAKAIMKKCLLPYRMMVIRPDGKVSLCCNDALGKYTLGDLEKNSIIEIWNSEDYRKIRNSMKKKGRKQLMLCCNCDTSTLPSKKEKHKDKGTI